MTVTSKLGTTFLLLLSACASSNDGGDNPGAAGDDVSGASDADIRRGASARLFKRTYKGSLKGDDGTTCNYDIAWLSVANLSKTALPKANLALDYGPKSTFSECEGGISLKGGYSSVTTNEAGILSVVYRHDLTPKQSASSNYLVTAVNLRIADGTRISLGDILTPAGIKTLVANCELQWTEAASPRGGSVLSDVCQKALTIDRQWQLTEGFSITKDGLRVHVDNQILRSELSLARSGFFVRWATLGAGLRSDSAVKALAGR